MEKVDRATPETDEVPLVALCDCLWVRDGGADLCIAVLVGSRRVKTTPWLIIIQGHDSYAADNFSAAAQFATNLPRAWA